MELFVHIGYPNAASTLFKRQLFSKHPQINYLGIENQKWKKKLNLFQNTNSNELLSFLGYYILHASEDEFEQSLEILKLTISKLKLLKNKTNLISFTGFLNPAKQNYHWSLKEADAIKEFFDVKIFNSHKYSFNETFETFSRIKKIFSVYDKDLKLNIFYFIRNQNDLFKSFYNHFDDNIHKVYKEEVKFKQIINKLDNISNKPDDEITYKIMSYFDFNKIHSELLSIFGEENVKIFVYEIFNKNNEKFLKILSSYLLIDPKISLNLISNKTENKDFRYKDGSFHKDSIFLTNLRNSLFFKIFRKILNKGVKLFIKRLLSKELINYSIKEKNIIKKFYLNGNINLSNKIKINLKELGYFL